jgi:hypothetical protein
VAGVVAFEGGFCARVVDDLCDAVFAGFAGLGATLLDGVETRGELRESGGR